MSVSNTEQVLLQGLIDRDEEVSTAFYERYYPQIYRLMFFSVSSRTDAEDLSRDSFLAFFKSLDRFQGKCKVSTWLYSIAKNTLRNYYTKKRRRKFVHIDDRRNDDLKSYLFDLEYDGPGPDELVQRQETIGFVHQALKNLPEHYREVLVHRYLNGHSTSSTAEIMGKSEGNIRVLLHRAGKVFAREFSSVEKKATGNLMYQTER